MPASILQRIAPFAGLLFAVLFVVGFVLPAMCLVVRIQTQTLCLGTRTAATA